MVSEKLTMALMEALTSMGQDHSDITISLLLNRLERFDEEHVLKSLAKCELSCRRIYLADIVENLPRKRVPIT